MEGFGDTIRNSSYRVPELPRADRRRGRVKARGKGQGHGRARRAAGARFRTRTRTRWAGRYFRWTFPLESSLYAGGKAASTFGVYPFTSHGESARSPAIA